MLTKEKMLECLRQLGAELSRRGMKGEILLTGGAAMCLVHSARDMTKDIDALYEPKTVINKIAADIAEREGLPSDWLNDGVKGFVGANAPTEEFMTFDGSYENQIIGLTDDGRYAIMRLSENHAIIHTLAPGETPPEVGEIVALSVDSNWLSAIRDRTWLY
ncbi:MAG: hypothetical protein LBS35_06870 [Synergistaceae bacterium]|jgi:hypothetical protein|nr:hypothetical protein [Synergistaceae bacterium]